MKPVPYNDFTHQHRQHPPRSSYRTRSILQPLFFVIAWAWAVNVNAQASGYIDTPPPRTYQQPPPDTEHLPLYDDLPVALRQTYPRPQLNIHYYNEAPEKRYVLINGFRAHEGLPIGQELWVYQILPDGVILQVQDRYFLVPANRNGGRR